MSADNIPYGKQDVSEQDISEVIKVLKSDFLTQGPAVPTFENAVAKKCHVNHAIAVNSATSALHIALMALEVGQGDIVWTSPNTFVASANAALYCGATIDFVDIDPNTSNMSVAQLEAKLLEAEKSGSLPKVVIPVHLTGQPCDMAEINRLSQIYNFKILEDASHAIGGKYKNKLIGDCLYSDITVFSFHPVKIITSGEGGMALTNSYSLAEKMRLFRSHGITRDAHNLREATHGPWYYEQVTLGYNYRMTDIQAALGLSQLQRLDTFIERRHEIAKHYNIKLKQLPLNLPYQEPFSYSSWHLYVVRLTLNERDKLTHLSVFEKLRQNGIQVNLHYIPVHTQPFYRDLGFKWGDFPEAEKYYRTAISLPIYPSMTQRQQKYVISCLESILN